MLKRTIPFFLLFFLPLSVFAIRIDTPKFTVKLSPNQSYNDTIIVSNDANGPINVKVYLQDFVYKPPFSGDKEFSSPGTTKFSMSKWINFSPRQFTIPAYSKKRVSFTITPPEGFDQVRCGTLFFETGIGKAPDEQGKIINIVARIGSLIFVEPEGSSKRATFNNVTGGRNKLKANFANVGGSFIHAKGIYFIMDAEGMAAGRDQIQDLYLLPQDKAELDIRLTKDIAPGEYTMVITFDMEEGAALVKEIDFSKSISGQIKVLQVRD